MADIRFSTTAPAQRAYQQGMAENRARRQEQQADENELDQVEGLAIEAAAKGDFNMADHYNRTMARRTGNPIPDEILRDAKKSGIVAMGRELYKNDQQRGHQFVKSALASGDYRAALLEAGPPQTATGSNWSAKTLLHRGERVLGRFNKQTGQAEMVRDQQGNSLPVPATSRSGSTAMTYQQRADLAARQAAAKAADGVRRSGAFDEEPEELEARALAAWDETHRRFMNDIQQQPQGSGVLAAPGYEAATGVNPMQPRPVPAPAGAPASGSPLARAAPAGPLATPGYQAVTGMPPDMTAQPMTPGVSPAPSHAVTLQTPDGQTIGIVGHTPDGRPVVRLPDGREVIMEQ